METKHVERFWRKTEAEPNTGCLLWAGTVDRHGYGLFRLDQKSLRLAHRVAYELSSGPIPTGSLVLHLCDVACCVNPRHLAIGDHSQNMRDRNGRGRTARGERNGQAKLSSGQVTEIRRRYDAGEDTQEALSLEYGVAVSTIWRAIHNHKWAHLESPSLLSATDDMG